MNDGGQRGASRSAGAAGNATRIANLLPNRDRRQKKNA
jgi:hypothetical protein